MLLNAAAGSPRCADCKHYNKFSLSSGACRRFPPVTVVKPVEDLQGFNVRAVTQFPEVPAEWACGEFALRLSA